MADAAGDIINDEGKVVRVVYTKTNVSIAKGNSVSYDTDGFMNTELATAAGVKNYISLDAVTADTTRQLFRILMQGVGRVAKTAAANAMSAGNVPTFDAAGVMKAGGNASGSMTLIKDAVDADTYYEVLIS